MSLNTATTTVTSTTRTGSMHYSYTYHQAEGGDELEHCYDDRNLESNEDW